MVTLSLRGTPYDSTPEKGAILAAYGYPANTDKSTGEFDHWYPHWMGGPDKQKYIWFEPRAGKFGSFATDKVELLLWRRVCVDKTMTLPQAKALYLKGGRNSCPNVEVVTPVDFPQLVGLPPGRPARS
jgi:hypothetical protein